MATRICYRQQHCHLYPTPPLLAIDAQDFRKQSEGTSMVGSRVNREIPVLDSGASSFRGQIVFTLKLNLLIYELKSGSKAFGPSTVSSLFFLGNLLGFLVLCY